MPTLVYKYGLFAPTAEAERVTEQMSLAHRYYNRLVELERVRRAKSREAIGAAPSFTPELDADINDARQRLEAIREKIRGERKRSRKRSESAEDIALANELRLRLSALTKARKELRAGAKHPEVKEKLHEFECEFRNQVKAARAASGLYWGTYLVIEAAIDAARKAPLWKAGEPADPRFRRWDGSGAIAIQLIHGLPVENFLEHADTRLQFHDVMLPAKPKPLRAGPKDATPTRLQVFSRPRMRIRVGSTDKRAPIFAEFPISMHRELPKEAKIKWAKVVRQPIAGKDKWSLHLTLELPEGWHREACGSGRVAIDLGWRKVEDGIRVAYVMGDDNRGGSLVLPNTVLARFQKVSDLVSIREKMLNELKAWFSDYVASKTPADQLERSDTPSLMPAEGPETSDSYDSSWFLEQTKTVALWRSAARFSQFIWQWRENRFPGDEEGFLRASAWRKQDRHLWTWEQHQRKRTLLHRREIYRVFAATLARRYGEVVFEKFDLRRVAKRAMPEEAGENDHSRGARQLAAVSELRHCVELAVKARGGTVTEVLATNTTRVCNACGTADEWDKGRELRHTCSVCLAEWDQDYNAALNLLRWSSAAPLPAKEKREARWRKRHKEEMPAVSAD